MRVDALVAKDIVHASQIKGLTDNKADKTTVEGIDNRVKVIEEDIPKKGLLVEQQALRVLADNTEYRQNLMQNNYIVT